jgi:hypothetical protein
MWIIIERKRLEQLESEVARLKVNSCRYESLLDTLIKGGIIKDMSWGFSHHYVCMHTNYAEHVVGLLLEHLNLKLNHVNSHDELVEIKDDD